MEGGRKRWRVWAAGLGGWLWVACGVGVGQDFTVRAVGADRVFDEGVAPRGLVEWFDPLAEGLKGGWYYGVGVDATYNSNMSLDESGEQDELVLSLTPSIFYTTDPEGGANCVVTGYYAPSAVFFTEDPDRNRINHSFGASLAVAGARTTITAFVDYLEYSGSDRYTGGFTEAAALRFGLGGSYQVAPRTVVHANVAASMSDYDVEGQTGSDNYSATLGALWAATERLQVGPSLRYSTSESDSSGDYETFAVLAECRYHWTERINLSAAAGPSFYDSSRAGGEDGVNLFLRLSADYRIDERWSWRTSIRYDTVTSPVAANSVVADYSISTSLSRQLDYGSVAGGLTYSTSDYEATGATTGGWDAGDNLRLFATYWRPVREWLDFRAMLEYATNEGERDWSQWVFGIGLNARF